MSEPAQGGHENEDKKKRVTRRMTAAAATDSTDPTATEEDRPDGCPCGEERPEGEGMIECTKCHGWWHVDCVNLSGLDDAAVLQLTSWHCPMCYQSPFTPLHLIKTALGANPNATTGEPLDNNELRQIIKSEIEAVKTEILDKQKTYADSLRSGLQKTTETLKETTDKKSSAALVQKVVTQMDADEIQRKKREANIIVKEIPEIADITDQEKVEEHAKYVLVEKCKIKEEDIVKCFRAGKLPEDNDNKPRPIVAKLRSREKAMSYCKDGRGARVEDKDDIDEDGNMAVYWINTDLCRADQEAQFFVRKERERRKAARLSANQ